MKLVVTKIIGTNAANTISKVFVCKEAYDAILQSMKSWKTKQVPLLPHTTTVVAGRYVRHFTIDGVQVMGSYEPETLKVEFYMNSADAKKLCEARTPVAESFEDLVMVSPSVI